MTQLVLSLFPGIGLLDQAFELEGFCVVRGPDLLWGGDVRRFHPPAGRFDGVIGGPPCQAFSSASGGQSRAENLIPEFERCVREARPRWFVMENVPQAPIPRVAGFVSAWLHVNNRWVGGEQNRVRRFTFGSPEGTRLHLSWVAMEVIDSMPCVTANATCWDATRQRSYSNRTKAYFKHAVRAQGLPPDFDLPGMTIEGKIRAVGNGVPLPLGRAIAAAVRRATEQEQAA